ncbi:hypothetical protein RW095_07455 [Paraburkholderia kirstenboschensis]|uniref:HTH lysR-type domain-containing protein n=1 Tax=Paraburkholderia kirstenboschensis TaxID=1245436 RepID=A0ABZ0E943_9BURK|nr:hypothetical protein [Paraburkholderia kirstenboschensis]WOD13781.1 hypothetical protein RW095_07455 [Paraburkholderia kirstenboschensis]
MSQALARLRRKFNDQVFVRVPRGMGSTSAHGIFGKSLPH